MLRRVACITALCIAPAAFALNNRSAVSVTGLDTNPCTTTSPCRSFSVAMSATVADGEIIALTSGGYGSFTIDKGITVSGVPGVHAAITTTAGDGITVNTAGVVNVTIRNLVLLNSPSAPVGTNGIRINTPSNVRVIGCVMRDFSTGQGAEIFEGNLSIDRSVITNCGVGIAVSNLNPGAGTVHATIIGTTIQGNNVATYHGADTVTALSHSTVSLGLDGIHVEATGAGAFTAVLTIEGCNIAENQNNGVFLNSNGNNQAKVYISDTLFDRTGSPVFLGAAGCTAYSFGNNEFVNSSAPGTLTPIAMK